MRTFQAWILLLIVSVVSPSHLSAAGEDRDRALAALQADVRANPQNTDALYMLALHYESKRDKTAALNTWRDYLRIETDKDKRAIAEKHIHHLSQ